MKAMEKKQKIYSVSEITRNIRIILEEAFGTAWIEGEVANYTLHSSGHMYFSIRDEKATLQCAMFKRANAKIGFNLKSGMKVICFGKISVYEARGNYQLIVENIEPKGVGALQIRFDELKNKLREEGLFDESHKVPIPHLPTRIGIVTSPTGAAIRDILNILKRRFANVEIIINPVKVQGVGAKEEIAQAIKEFNKLKNIDVMIVTRGGGSLEDLWPFNEEIVARAIYESEIPIISAVGHEIDYTISDFTADLRVPTPSAAAELVIPEKKELINRIENCITRLKNTLFSKLDILTEKLATLKESYCLKQPLNIITQHEQKIDDIIKSIFIHTDHVLKFKNENFNLLIQKLEALSPLGILNRGYSITMTQESSRIIKDIKDLNKGGLIKTKLAKGNIISKIEMLEK